MKKKYIKLFEKTYKGKHHNIQYLNMKHYKSQYIVVSLSGFNGNEVIGEASKYNYIRTLKGIQAHKLFIKDDVNGLPTYYYGVNSKPTYLEDCVELIRSIQVKCNIPNNRLIFAGSSKGGTGALLIGRYFEGAHIIAGAFQLYPFKYIDSLNETLSNKLSKQILGDLNCDENKNKLDREIANRILDSNKKNFLYLHGGLRDKHYIEHMKPMIHHLDKVDKNYELELKNYEKHEHVKYYFPDFFRRIVIEIVNQPIILEIKFKSSSKHKLLINGKNIKKEGVYWAVYIINEKRNPIYKIDYTNELVIPLKPDQLIHYKNLYAKVFLKYKGQVNKSIFKISM